MSFRAASFNAGSLEERFWMYVAEPDENGCRMFSGHTDDKGYGRFRFRDDARGMGAHIVSLIFATGGRPDGMHALHRCDNKGCVEPSHLYWGTPYENMRDKIRTGNVNKKLTREDVREMRRRHAEGESFVSLGNAFGVTAAHASKIVRGLSWKHI